MSKGYNTFGCTVLQHYREDPPGLFPLETLKIDINFKYVYCMYHMIHVTGFKEYNLNKQNVLHNSCTEYADFNRVGI